MVGGLCQESQGGEKGYLADKQQWTARYLRLTFKQHHSADTPSLPEYIVQGYELSMIWIQGNIGINIFFLLKFTQYNCLYSWCEINVKKFYYVFHL